MCAFALFAFKRHRVRMDGLSLSFDLWLKAPLVLSRAQEYQRRFLRKPGAAAVLAWLGPDKVRGHCLDISAVFLAWLGRTKPALCRLFFVLLSPCAPSNVSPFHQVAPQGLRKDIHPHGLSCPKPFISLRCPKVILGLLAFPGR